MSATAVQGPRSGLIVATGPVPDDRALEAAAATSPWRGGVSRVERTDAGVVAALGDAWLWRFGGDVIALHGRIDAIDGREADRVGEAELGALLADLLARDPLPSCARLVGDYVLVHADRARGRITVQKAWIASRPMFWAAGRDGGRVVLASEIRMIFTLLGERPPIDEETLAEFAAYGDPSERATALRGVEAVPNRGAVVVRGGHAQTHLAVPSPGDADPDRDVAARRLRADLQRAVERRVRGASRVACELSGGMDSSSVAAAAAAARDAGRVETVAAVTLGFPQVPAIDEQDLARATAARLGVSLAVVDVRTSDATGWAEEASSRHWLTHPTAFFAARTIPRAAAGGAEVVLTGQGGDYVTEPRSSEVEASLIGRDAAAAAAWLAHDLIRRPGHALKGVRSAAARTLGARTPRPGVLAATAEDWWLRVGMETYERLGAMEDVRVEHPYLDVDLVRHLAGLPVGSRWWPPLTKALLRRAVSEELPSLILRRPDKTSFDDLLHAAELDSDERPFGSTEVLAERWRSTWTFEGGRS